MRSRSSLPGYGGRDHGDTCAYVYVESGVFRFFYLRSAPVLSRRWPVKLNLLRSDVERVTQWALRRPR